MTQQFLSRFGVRFKLDENLGNRGAELLRHAGHEVATVFEQHLN